MHQRGDERAQIATSLTFSREPMKMVQPPTRERADLALTATFAWREAPVRLFSPALRSLVERMVSGIDEVEAAFSGLRPADPALRATPARERARHALRGLSQALTDARKTAGSQTVIRSVETAFRATEDYVERVGFVLNTTDAR